ncbi:Pre-rRNA-processing protein ESF2 [Lachnellula suecica]|uniref:18S rRNA factor 2 n=1 Tax=Lachnellula suecica TaxID=602035 RepID=A0A8T9C6C7_9HELO|nr:Pre-rRNA-processing protein ESF2 [Lachnellula suecica]
MATRKHNEFLDADQSEDDGSQGYDSEIEDLKKGGRSPKRRKVDSDVSDEEAEEDEEGLDDQYIEEKETNERGPKDKKASKDLSKSKELPGVSKPLTKKNLVASAAAIKQSGVVYLSRIPPFMKPTKLRSLLEPYGAINRIFLSPEDPTSHARRVRNGGNKKRSFTDGWVEFTNKADAKHACELLNARTIGGKKGTYYHDDVWNLLYLKGFKWNNLTEQISAENAERSSRMRAEISKTTKENKEFVQNVERAKMLEGMEAKKAAKRRKDDEDTPRTEESSKPAAKEHKESGDRPRHFKQTQVAAKNKAEDQPEQVKRVLSKYFSSFAYAEAYPA